MEPATPEQPQLLPFGGLLFTSLYKHISVCTNTSLYKDWNTSNNTSRGRGSSLVAVFIMIRTKEAMDTDVGESQPRLRVLIMINGEAAQAA
jgi:hypothetical protein